MGDYFMVYKPTYNWGAPSCGDLFEELEDVGRSIVGD
jgi:hypothetical protein